MTSVITSIRFWARSMKKKAMEGGRSRVMRRSVWAATAAITLCFNLFWCQAMVTYSCYVYTDLAKPCEKIKAQYVCMLASVYLGFNSTLMAVVFCLDMIKARLPIIFMTVMTYAAVALTACIKADDIINRGAFRFLGLETNCSEPLRYNATDMLGEEGYKTVHYSYIDNIDLSFMIVFVLFMLTMMCIQLGLAIYTAKKEDGHIERTIRLRRELREAQRQARLLEREYGAVCLCQLEAQAAKNTINREEKQVAESVA